MKKSRDIDIARFLAGEMSVEEEIGFRNKTEVNPVELSELKNMENTWKYFDKDPLHGNGDSRDAWDKLYGRLNADGMLDGQSVKTGTKNLLPVLRVAASFLLILAIGIPALYLGVIKKDMTDSVLNRSSEKGVRTINLPDGSRVFLNEGAEISYPPEFNQGRSVELKGEAFFEVMSDPVNPFTVRSGKVVVSVLGTSFNIKESLISNEVEVYVTTGKVRMALENSGNFINLEPGEIGQINKNNLSRVAQIDPNYISWKTKDFKFVDAELTDVLGELEESYHVAIHRDQVILNGMKITTSYEEQSIDAILETIGTAFGLIISHKEDGYYLTN